VVARGQLSDGGSGSTPWGPRDRLVGSLSRPLSCTLHERLTLPSPLRGRAIEMAPLPRRREWAGGGSWARGVG
jgi:hypothetical protein